MSEKMNSTKDAIAVEGRKALDVANGLIEQGNTRTVVIRQADGTKIISVSLTVAVAVTVAAVIFTFPWFLIVGVIAVLAKIKLEVVSFVDADNDIVTLDDKPKHRLDKE